MRPTEHPSSSPTCRGSQRVQTPIRLELAGVPETLLIPLYMRFLETQRSDPIVRDGKAREIIESLDYNFAQFKRPWITQVDIAVRTEIFDEATRAFIARHPQATIVNLGAGLDGRFWRVNNGQITWFDLDLPEVVELRSNFYQESGQNRTIAKSILDWTWLDEIGRPLPQQLLIIVEGVLPYFTEDQVRTLFAQIGSRFPGAEVLFQSTSPECVKKHRKIRPLKHMDAPFRWGISSAREVQSWDCRYEHLAEWALIDRHQDRWRGLRYLCLLAPVRRRLREAMKISHVRLGSPPLGLS